MALTHLSLFSGIGGLDLAAEWAGFETVGQCEWADFPTKVLEKHWPDVPRWRDIRTLNKEDFYERTGRRTVDVISGGFPCQPFSVAGNQKGKEDERYLWPEMLRVVRELAPRWVIGENVSGILQIAAADVVKDLERLGYHVVVFTYEAAAVGARHRRQRVFFVANSRHCGCNRSDNESEQSRRTNAVWSSEVISDTKSKQTDGIFKHGSSTDIRASGNGIFERRGLSGSDQWIVEPDVGRVANGISCRMDRLKCLGNAVVPQQAYPIFKAIAELEKGLENV